MAPRTPPGVIHVGRFGFQLRGSPPFGELGAFHTAVDQWWQVALEHEVVKVRVGWWSLVGEQPRSSQ